MLNIHNLDFTLDTFYKLCSTITEKYPTIIVGEYVIGGNKYPECFVLIRPGVDGRAETALDTVRIEKELGIQATRYFINIFLHPNRWTLNRIYVGLFWLEDLVFNSEKKVLLVVRK